MEKVEYMTVYVIVVLFNGAKWIDKCFNSLLKSQLNLKIIAVDNASTDDSVQLLKSKYPSVNLVESKVNLGFGKANNIGLKIALEKSCDYVFLLNQDAWVQPETIKLLIENHLQNKEYGILSPVHLNGSGTSLDVNFAKYMEEEVTPGFLSDTYFANQKSLYQTAYVNAAAWLISKKCLEMVGGFDPVFPHYGEDNDYLKRVSYFGLKTGVVTEAKVYHDRICKSHSELSLDVNRRFIVDILKVKSLQVPFFGNFFYYSKHKFDEITSKLMYRQFLEAKLTFHTYLKIVRMLPRLFRSYKISRNQNKAFIQ